MSYQKYGIDPELVNRVKRKLKQPAYQEQTKVVLNGVNKADLQDPAKVKKLMYRLSKTLNEPISSVQGERIVKFVLSQKIDPNTLHLLKLWSMFR